MKTSGRMSEMEDVELYQIGLSAMASPTPKSFERMKAAVFALAHRRAPESVRFLAGLGHRLEDCGAWSDFEPFEYYLQFCGRKKGPELFMAKAVQYARVGKDGMAAAALGKGRQAWGELGEREMALDAAVAECLQVRWRRFADRRAVDLADSVSVAKAPAAFQLAAEREALLDSCGPATPSSRARAL